MWTANSSEKTLILGKIEGRKRRWQRMRWLNVITNSTDMNFGKFWEIAEERGAWSAAVHGVMKSWTLLSNWTTTTCHPIQFPLTKYGCWALEKWLGWIEMYYECNIHTRLWKLCMKNIFKYLINNVYIDWILNIKSNLHNQNKKNTMKHLAKHLVKSENYSVCLYTLE